MRRSPRKLSGGVGSSVCKDGAGHPPLAPSRPFPPRPRALRPATLRTVPWHWCYRTHRPPPPSPPSPETLPKRGMVTSRPSTSLPLLLSLCATMGTATTLYYYTSSGSCEGNPEVVALAVVIAPVSCVPLSRCGFRCEGVPSHAAGCGPTCAVTISLLSLCVCVRACVH